jgi:hypothetical protein
MVPMTLTIVGMIGAIGFAVDVANAAARQRMDQGAADAAASQPPTGLPTARA